MEAAHPTHPEKPRFRRHPIIFTILIVPFGVSTGFSSVALAYLATRRGLSIENGAEIIAIGFVPQMWKFLWAPIADATLNRHAWHVISTLLVAGTVFAMATVPLGPSTFRYVLVLVFLSSLASTFTGFAVEGMIAHLTTPEDRCRISGWYQAGNLGGSGIGGGLGLWLLSFVSGTVTGFIVAAATAACALALFWIPRIPRDEVGRSPVSMARTTVVELWRLAVSREGALCGLLCFLPLGTGTASGVLSQADVASYWNASANMVALIQGTIGGVVSMFGCVAGGYGCMRLGARGGYVVYGLLMAVTSLAMAVLPATPTVYVVLCLLYQVTNGLCYAAFSAFVLETIGARLAATKYNGFASLSNTPIWYMGLLLAYSETKFGPRGMLVSDFAIGAAAVAAFYGVLLAWKPAAEPAAA